MAAGLPGMMGGMPGFMPTPEGGAQREEMIKQMMCGVLGEEKDWGQHTAGHVAQVRQCMENAMGHVGGIVEQEWPEVPAGAVSARRTAKRVALCGEFAAEDLAPELRRGVGKEYEVWVCDSEVDFAHRLAVPKGSKEAPAVAMYFCSTEHPSEQLVPLMRHFVDDGGLLVYCSDHPPGFLSRVCSTVAGWDRAGYYRTTFARTAAGAAAFPDGPATFSNKGVWLENVPASEALYTTTSGSKHESLAMVINKESPPSADVTAVAYHAVPGAAPAGALLYIGDCNWEASTSALLRDATLDFIHPGARDKLTGNAHFKQGQHALAVAAYSRAIGHAPRDAVLYTNRSIAHLKAGDSAAALADADKALALDPAWAKGQLRRGQALMALDKHAEALAALEQVASVDGVKDAIAECRAKLT